MKFYELLYPEETGADGYSREYFNSRDAAKRRRAELRRELADAWKQYRAWEQAGSDYYTRPAMPCYNIAESEINVLTFTGTPRQMVLQALESRAL